MSASNRVLNRVFLAVVGLLLIAAGAAAIALATVPALAAQWRRTAADLATGASAFVAAPVAGTASALVLVVGGAALVLAILLVVFVARHGGGRTRLSHVDGSGPAATRVDVAVPRALLEQHLGSRPEIAAVHVSAWTVKRTPTLLIELTCRRGVSPAVAAGLAGDAVARTETLLGARLPAMIRLSGGLRSRRGAPVRVS